MWTRNSHLAETPEVFCGIAPLRSWSNPQITSLSEDVLYRGLDVTCDGVYGSLMCKGNAHGPALAVLWPTTADAGPVTLSLPPWPMRQFFHHKDSGNMT